jgi:hypothetical protein
MPTGALIYIVRLIEDCFQEVMLFTAEERKQQVDGLESGFRKMFAKTPESSPRLAAPAVAQGGFLLP